MPDTVTQSTVARRAGFRAVRAGRRLQQLELLAEHELTRALGVAGFAMLGVGIAVHAALVLEAKVGAVLAREAQRKARALIGERRQRFLPHGRLDAGQPRSILFTRRVCRPPSNSVPRNACKISRAVSTPTTRAPRH